MFKDIFNYYEMKWFCCGLTVQMKYFIVDLQRDWHLTSPV